MYKRSRHSWKKVKLKEEEKEEKERKKGRKKEKGYRLMAPGNRQRISEMTDFASLPFKPRARMNRRQIMMNFGSIYVWSQCETTVVTSYSGFLPMFSLILPAYHATLFFPAFPVRL